MLKFDSKKSLEVEGRFMLTNSFPHYIRYTDEHIKKNLYATAYLYSRKNLVYLYIDTGLSSEDEDARLYEWMIKRRYDGGMSVSDFLLMTSLTSDRLRQVDPLRTFGGFGFYDIYGNLLL